MISGDANKAVGSKAKAKQARRDTCPSLKEKQTYFSSKRPLAATINTPRLVNQLVLNQALRRTLEAGLLSALEDGDFERTALKLEEVCARIPKPLLMHSNAQQAAMHLRCCIALLQDININTNWLQRIFTYFQDEEVLFDLAVEAQSTTGEDIVEALASLMNHIRRCRAVRMRGFADIEPHKLDGLEEAMAYPSADQYGGEVCPADVPPGAWGQRVTGVLFSEDEAASSNARLYASIRSKRLDSSWDLGDGVPLSVQSRTRIAEQIIEEVQSRTDAECCRAEPEYSYRKMEKQVATQTQTTVGHLIKCAEAAGEAILVHLEVNLGHTCTLSVRPEAEVRQRAYRSLKGKAQDTAGWAEPVDIARVHLRFNSCEELVRGIHEIQRCCEVKRIENCLAQPSPLGRRDVRIIVLQRISESITNGDATHLVQLRLELSCLAEAHREASSLVDTLMQRVAGMPCEQLIIARLAGNRGPPSYDNLLAKRTEIDSLRTRLVKELEWLDELLKTLIQDGPNKEEFLKRLKILGSIRDLVLEPLSETLDKIDSVIAQWRRRRARDKAPVLSGSLILSLLDLHGGTREKIQKNQNFKPARDPPPVVQARRFSSGGVGGQGGTRCHGLAVGGGGNRQCIYSKWIPEQATRRPASVECIRSASRLSEHRRELSAQEETMLSMTKDQAISSKTPADPDVRLMMCCLYSEKQKLKA